jgi:HSP20 family molecular chaperone IbpA
MTTTSKSSKTKKVTGKTSHSLVNISEGNQEYIIYVVVPGMLRDDVSICIKDKKLTVTASKKEALHCFMDNENKDFSHWSKCIDLPADADTVMTAAIYRNGELQIHIPKGKAEDAGEPTEVFVY